MWRQFFLENIHFALYLFSALVMFSIAWLYLDAWIARKNTRELIRTVGFLILSLSFTFSAAFIEPTLLPNPFVPISLLVILIGTARIIGYAAIITSLIIDPIQKRPEYKALIPFSLPIKIIYFCYPFLSAIAGILYFRKATTGLENHLKKIAYAFFILTLSEACTLAGLFQNTSNSTLFNLIKPFGMVWIAQHVILFIATMIFAKWVFTYLLRRFQTQLFIIFTSGVLIIFIITTTVFTTIILQSMQKEQQRQLESDAKILEYTLITKQNELQLQATELSQNPLLLAAVEKKSHDALAGVTEKYLLNNKITSLIVLSDSHQVLIRAEDNDRYGDSLTDYPIVKALLAGLEATSLTTKSGVVSPLIQIQTAKPILKEDKRIGIIILAQNIDNTFLDGIKDSTGFESALYANNLLSATTLVSEDSARPLGAKESNTKITQTVLQKGQVYRGVNNINSIDYNGAFIPLKNSDKIPIGMLFVGKPEIDTLQNAAKSIEYTFLAAILLMSFSIIPAYFVSKSISGQLK